MSKIIAISNQKGGVGKSTTAYNLGACLSLNHGKKVLLVDIDPQANLSDYLGYEPDGQPTLTQLIMTACMGNVTGDNVKLAIRHCEAAEVDYIPADINLASTEAMMVSAISRETILRRILSEDVVKDYDFVIIDCLPSLSSLLINALAVADKVLIPVQTQKFSMDGLQALESLYSQIRTTLNPNSEIIGILPTMTDRTNTSKKAVETLAEKYDKLVFSTHISKLNEAIKSCENRVPLCFGQSRLGTQYESLAEEVLERC